MKWSTLEPIPKIPRWMAVKHPSLLLRKSLLVLGAVEIRFYDLLLNILARMIKGPEPGGEG